MLSSLTALVLATPVFGFSLSIDLPALELAAPAQVTAATATPDPDTTEATDATGDDASASASTTLASDPGAGPDAEGGESVSDQLARRARMGRIHRILGLSTFGAMTATVVLGTLQYANLYGFFDSAAGSRCGRGNAFFGQDACTGTPVPHLVTAFTTAGLYYATFGLSYAMPDPIGLDRGDSRAARRLRQHKRLRWAHFAGMASQIVLGMLSANSHWLGLDRTNDYRAQQALATVHLAVGYATYATLTWAGALMTFD